MVRVGVPGGLRLPVSLPASAAVPDHESVRIAVSFVLYRVAVRDVARSETVDAPAAILHNVRQLMCPQLPVGLRGRLVV